MKKTGLIIIGSIVLVFVILSTILISGYNRLIEADENINLEYARIDYSLQRRYDTLTQLANSINGFQAHEQAYFDAITQAREAYASAFANNDIAAMAEADNLQSIALSNLIAAFEQNPELKATEAYGDYNDAVWGIETALSDARRKYNEAINEYNLLIRKFPGLIYADMFDFEQEDDYWKVGENATDVPDIVFGNTGN
ncbi:MAG: LemA family protein [Candidatus Izemoplasmatales bacterium]|jgi:LemA protein|nr:LemA family protein [Candidatus Izemoplasmatales bacterium]